MIILTSNWQRGYFFLRGRALGGSGVNAAFDGSTLDFWLADAVFKFSVDGLTSDALVSITPDVEAEFARFNFAGL